MEWAWSQDTASSGERLVLLCMADHAGTDGECWPSSGSLGERCALSGASVRRHIDALEERGLIEKVERRRRGDGTLGTWLYRLAIHRAPAPTGQERPVVTDERTTAQGCAVDQRAPVRALEPSSLEPSLEPSPLVLEGVEAVVAPDGFEAFWQMYPRKVGKANAEKVWKRLTKAEHAAVMATLPEHVRYWQATKTGPTFIAHPATWLHGRRWEDELPHVPASFLGAVGAAAARPRAAEARDAVARLAGREAVPSRGAIDATSTETKGITR